MTIFCGRKYYFHKVIPFFYSSFLEKIAAFFLKKFDFNPKIIIHKVFSEDELRFIADLCKQHNVIALMDEVYEWIVYKGHRHVRMGKIIHNFLNA